MHFDDRVTAVPDDRSSDAAEAASDQVLVLLPGSRDSLSGGQTIRFVAGRPFGRCVLRIFDIRGSLVGEMNADGVDKGLHELTWNARNRNGAPVGSGVYLLLLEADGHRATSKIVLLR